VSTSPTFSTSSSACLVICGSSCYNSDTGTGFTGTGSYTMVAQNFNYSNEGYQITTSMTGETVTFTGSASTPRCMSVAAFIQASSSTSDQDLLMLL
jgi:hypothetical protein